MVRRMSHPELRENQATSGGIVSGELGSLFGTGWISFGGVGRECHVWTRMRLRGCVYADVFHVDAVGKFASVIRYAIEILDGCLYCASRDSHQAFTSVMAISREPSSLSSMPMSFSRDASGIG